MPKVDLDTRLDGVLGARTAGPLEKAFGVRTVGDLVRHYPRRMIERGELTDLSELRVDEDVTVMAKVISAGEKGYGKGLRVEVVIGDGTGELQLVFFGPRQRWRLNELVPGTLGLFSGKVGEFRGKRQLAHPDYKIVRGHDGVSDFGLDGALASAEADIFAGALIPVYPASKDVRSWVIANSIEHVLRLMDDLTDPLPDDIRERHGLVGFDAAIRGIHRPESYAAWYAARHRLKWDEAFGVQLVLARRRLAVRTNPAVPHPRTDNGILAAFDERLPFTLTEGQREVGEQIAEQLAQPHPMHRLLQGEVGSGKTIVALRAMLQVIDSGGQAALLAPTEVLAAQHARTLETMLGPLAHAGQLGGADSGTRVALLTGSLPGATRKAALLDAASGAAGIVVGTHALIQEHVQFAELGLVVVDEQHRFGVEQRDALRAKAAQPPHLLVMTATPIPRTVAMTVFGDLETSTLTELPKGRAPISTTVVPTAEKPEWLNRVWARIREEVADGRQAYIVCPRIGEGVAEPGSEPDSADGVRTAAVIDVLAMLSDPDGGPLADCRLAPLHGRLAPEDKERIMLDFSAGRIDVLVSTTVVEVGVDVPNATVMAVLDAERFGVSQLHQLRGRVGRGGHPGLCLLVTDQPAQSPSRERLEAVAATTDGFALARLDVEQRHEGDVLGVAQSGRRSQFALLSLLRDEELIGAARAEAGDLIENDPELVASPLLAAQVAVLAADERAEYLDKG